MSRRNPVTANNVNSADSVSVRPRAAQVEEGART
jgi:hypothetical protein